MKSTASTESARTSAEETLDRFNTSDAAAKYARSLGGTATHRREVRSILRALAGLPQGARVLDLPCGTGRLLPALVARGLQVVEADSSPHMVASTREYARSSGIELPEDRFLVASVFDIRFPNDSFDAVVCNRLFHHFRERDVRRRALAELSRVSRGPIVASFFSSATVDGVIHRLRYALRGREPTDRIPIPPVEFADDVRAAGLRVVRWIAPRRWVAKQLYAVLARTE